MRHTQTSRLRSIKFNIRSGKTLPEIIKVKFNSPCMPYEPDISILVFASFIVRLISTGEGNLRYLYVCIEIDILGVA